MSNPSLRKMATSVSAEDSTIKRLRVEQGVTVRELARRLSVTPGAISQMERSEAAGTIGVGTLRRAVEALGAQLILTITNEHDRPGSVAPFERREDRVTYELHRAVAKKLVDDPERVLEVVPANIAMLRQQVRGDLAQQWLDQWETASRGPVRELIRLMLGEDSNSKDLRQTSPFAGVLTQQERVVAIARASGRSVRNAPVNSA